MPVELGVKGKCGVCTSGLGLINFGVYMQDSFNPSLTGVGSVRFRNTITGRVVSDQRHVAYFNWFADSVRTANNTFELILGQK